MGAKRTELLLVCAVAVALVALRGFVATYYEGFYFDSDQAIVGLMARHIAAFHHFPVFYYSLNYLLAVQAWIAAPFFWIARSSVAVMRFPFVVMNAGVAVAFVVMIGARLRIRPLLAFVAALPFIIPTPATANQMLELAGVCIEPFVYVLLLWRLRGRALLFGGLLAVAFLHREFILAIVPAILIVEGLRRPLWTPVWTMVRWKPVAQAAGGFFLVWLVVDDLKLRLSGGALGDQAASLAGQMCVEPKALADGVRELFTSATPVLLGARSFPIRGFRMDSSLVAGSAIIGVVVALALAIVIWRLIACRAGLSGPPGEAGRSQDMAFGLYLALTGVFVASMYPLSCNIAVGLPPLLRYMLLVLLVPIGLAATFFAVEQAPRWRAIVAGAFVIWAGANLVDNVRLIRLAAVEPPLNERRALTDYLIDHHIRYARAIYWDAYMIDFLSRERVITSSIDTIRIPEYQKEVDDHGDAAVVLERMPCEEPVKVGAWCVSAPGK